MISFNLGRYHIFIRLVLRWKRMGGGKLIARVGLEFGWLRAGQRGDHEGDYDLAARVGWFREVMKGEG